MSVNRKSLIGSDPEVFCVNSLGECIPPVILRKLGMPFTTKHLNKNLTTSSIESDREKHPVFAETSSYKIIEDGAAFEINTKPTKDTLEYYSMISNAIGHLENLVRKFGYSITIKPAVIFNPEILYIDGVLDSYANYCVRFGCDPDLDIYSGLYSKEVDASNINKRFGGGHIHISNIDTDRYFEIGRLMDIILGNAFISSLETEEEVYLEKDRHEFYGLPGKLRIQTYSKKDNIKGIEYRTPSNLWIKDLGKIGKMFTATSLLLKVIDNLEKFSGPLIETYLESSIKNILEVRVDDSASIMRKVYDTVTYG